MSHKSDSPSKTANVVQTAKTDDEQIRLARRDINLF
jgi:hypothetical protein